MDYFSRDGAIYLKQEDLNLDETLDCGQAFRWEKIPGGYSGHFKGHPLTVTAEKDFFVFHSTAEDEFLHIWADYFDLFTDYGELKRLYMQDETLTKACAFAGGMRLLRQDPWEALCSFILSQNNNIPRIKGIIARLCALCGGFPEPQTLAALSLEELSPIRAGFRGKYILDAARKVSGGEVVLADIASAPLEEGRLALQTVQGVGPKVAECALLYGMHRVEAFPLDVWIKRVMAWYYPGGLPEYLLPTAGMAQQYLFHYVRHNSREMCPDEAAAAV